MHAHTYTLFVLKPSPSPTKHCICSAHLTWWSLKQRATKTTGSAFQKLSSGQRPDTWTDKTARHDGSSILSPNCLGGGGGAGIINKDPSLKPEALSRHWPLAPWRRWCPAAAPGTRQPWCPLTPDVPTPQSPQSSAAALCCPPAGWLLEHRTVTTALLHDTDHRAVTWQWPQGCYMTVTTGLLHDTYHMAVTWHWPKGCYMRHWPKGCYMTLTTGLLHDSDHRAITWHWPQGCYMTLTTGLLHDTDHRAVTWHWPQGCYMTLTTGLLHVSDHRAVHDTDHRADTGHLSQGCYMRHLPKGCYTTYWSQSCYMTHWPKGCHMIHWPQSQWGFPEMRVSAEKSPLPTLNDWSDWSKNWVSKWANHTFSLNLNNHSLKQKRVICSFL